jgi:transcriptional repressor NrdR
MKCPFCHSTDNGVVDSRETEDGRAIRRRRSCANCTRRFTTYERVDEQPILVIKKNGARAPFDRARLIAGMSRACEKRPVSSETLDRIAADIEKRASETGERELSSRWFGEQVMRELQGVDEVAYVRFASVYRSFKDVDEFARELERLKAQPTTTPVRASPPEA